MKIYSLVARYDDCDEYYIFCSSEDLSLIQSIYYDEFIDDAQSRYDLIMDWNNDSMSPARAIKDAWKETEDFYEYNVFILESELI